MGLSFSCKINATEVEVKVSQDTEISQTQPKAKDTNPNSSVFF